MERKPYQKNESELLVDLKTNLHGLSSEDAKERINQYGKNALPANKKNSAILIFLKQFVSPIIIVLLVAMVLCLVVNELSNATFIFAVVTINATIGAIQEVNAEKSASKLQNMIKIKARVIRNNKQIEIDAEDLTIGDIVLLESGDKVGADIRLLKVQNLQIDESILTGESLPIHKTTDPLEHCPSIGDCENTAFAGTIVSSGRGTGVVYAIGLQTEFGKIADNIIGRKNTPSPLVIRMNKFIHQITMIFSIFAVIVSIFLYFKGYIIQEIFFLIISLTVSAIPEGLSIAMTVALSKSSSRLAKQKVIVKKLNAVESLGSCTVIASDKTGTLTLNQQTAKRILLPSGQYLGVKGAGYNDQGYLYSNDNSDLSLADLIIKLGVINNEATLVYENEWIKQGDSIDAAFLALGLKVKSQPNVKIVNTIPYESQAKYSAVFYQDDGLFCTLKGSCERILDFCDSMLVNRQVVPLDKQHILEQSTFLAKKGYRVIALAYGKVEKELKAEVNESDIPSLIFCGLVGFIDPIREETIEAINTCTQAGIKVVMITGDHPLTAFAVAEELSLVSSYDQVISGSELEQLTPEQFDEAVNKCRVFARVSPLNKLAIVESLQKNGHFVAVTGDGVNDSPALKSANIGIAMGRGSDIAKETGNMIISDDNFVSIVKGVKEGRIAYCNIRNVIYLLLSTGFSEIILFLLAILFNLPTPMIAVQLLWLNLISNGIQDVAISFEKGENWVMKQKPRSPKEGIFNHLMIQELFLSAIIIALIGFGLYRFCLNYVNEVEARSYVLLFMVLVENIHIFNCRSEYTSCFRLPLKNNYLVISTLSICIVIQCLITIFPTPLSRLLQISSLEWYKVLAVLALCLPLLVIMEIFKTFKRRALK